MASRCSSYFFRPGLAWSHDAELVTRAQDSALLIKKRGILIKPHDLRQQASARDTPLEFPFPRPGLKIGPSTSVWLQRDLRCLSRYLETSSFPLTDDLIFAGLVGDNGHFSPLGLLIQMRLISGVTFKEQTDSELRFAPS